jgi:hypothetical protein
MNLLIRVLGLQALSIVLQRLSPRAARLLSFCAVAASTTYPLWAVLTGRWGAGDVLVTFWLENIAVGFWLLVRALTATHAYDRPGAFSMTGTSRHPGGWRLSGRPAKLASTAVGAMVLVFFTGLHGVLAYALFHDLTRTGDAQEYLRMLGILWAAHGIGTAVVWFGQGLRHNPDPRFIVGPAARRLTTLHVTVLLGAVVATRVPMGAREVAMVLLLIAIKLAVDLRSYLRPGPGSGKARGHHVLEHTERQAS